MKIFILFCFMFIISTLQADLIIKRKKNFNSCQEVYETGHFKGDGFYKIRKDNTLQDIKCKEDIQLKEEYNYYNGIEGKTLNWEDIEPSRNCDIQNDIQNNDNSVFIATTACIQNSSLYKADTGIRYRKNDIVEIEFNFQRFGIGAANDLDVFGILKFYYRRKQPSFIFIGNDSYGIDGFQNNKVKIIREKNKYTYYLNEELVSEKIYDFSNINDSAFIAETFSSNIEISNVNIKVYKHIYIENIN